MPSDTGQDDELNRAIANARHQFEARTDKAVLAQTYELHLPTLADVIVLPHPPLSAVSSVHYYDGSDFQAVDPAVYHPVPENFPGLLTRVHGQAWPVAPPSIMYPYKITYVAGAALPAEVDEDIKGAILTLAGLLYEHRVTAEPGQLVAVPHTFEAICAQHRVFMP